MAARAHFLAARTAQSAGDLETAAREYAQAVSLAPDFPEAFANLGLTDFALHRFSAAIEALSKAERLRPGMRGMSLYLGLSYLRLHQPVAALPWLREACRHDPDSKDAQSWLATALWDVGQPDAALLQLHAAMRHFPDDPGLLFALGEAYGKAADQQMQQLLNDSPDTALYHLVYGTIYAEEHKWRQAEGHLSRAVKLDPRMLEARLELVSVMLLQAHLSLSLDEAQQAVVSAPRSAAALAQAGEVLLLLHRQEEGLAHIEMALKIDSDATLDAFDLPVEDRFDHRQPDAELLSRCRETLQQLQTGSTHKAASAVAIAALNELAGDDAAASEALRSLALPHSTATSFAANLSLQADAAFHRHRYEDAETLLLRWLAAHPQDKNARYRLALARTHLALEMLRRMVAVAPESYHVHQMLAHLYFSRDQDDQAIAEYQAAAAEEPNLPGIHFWLGHIAWKHGNAQQAETEFQRELKLDPANPEANGELGAVLVAQERTAEAIPHLESAIQSDPDLWPAYLQLGRAYAKERDYSRAEAVLRRSLAHDLGGFSYYQLGLVLRTEGKSAEAVKMFARVRAIKSQHLSDPDVEKAENGDTQP